MNYKAIADSMSPRVGPTQEWVYQVLRTGIVGGEIPGNTQLKQDEISAALNVSHIPVREAFRRLEAQGLVCIHPNRGASVSQLSRDAIMDMMEVRATLSVMMLRNGFDKLTAEDFDEMKRVIAEQRNAKDLITSEELNYRFHDILSSKADNSFAELLMELVHANIDRYVRSGFYTTDENRALSIRQHEQILEACRENDVDKACELLRQHIMDAKRYIPDELN